MGQHFDCWLQTCFGTKVTQHSTATKITHHNWDIIGAVGCKHVLGQSSHNKYSNTNHAEQVGQNWDSWLQTCVGTKFKQHITATEITHNSYDDIGTVGCNHVLGQGSHSKAQQQKPNRTIETHLGLLVANTFWDKAHTTNHSNTNHSQLLGYNRDSWLQTCFVGKVHTTKHSNKNTNNHWDNIGTVGCKHVLGHSLHNKAQQHKSNKSSGMHLGQLVANTFWDNIFRQGPKPAIPTNLQPTMATVYRQSSYGRESRAKII